MTEHKVIGVCPPVARANRRRLLSALEQVFPARFEARQPGDHRGLDALVLVDESASNVVGLPCLVMHEADPSTARGMVQFSTSSRLDGRLRGCALADDRAHGLTGLAHGGEASSVVASCGRNALWVRGAPSGSVDRVALAPDELEPTESLRDELVPGRWLGLLPLVHLLREVCAELSWTPPPLRATFLVDDPNLHWPSYGHLAFAELVRHASEHGYHVAIATIPLDGWFVHPRVARLVRDRGDVLSLLPHGNDHVRGELTRPRSEDDALRMLAQATRRLSALEHRVGVEVPLLMVAPFGRCSAEMMRALLIAGFEGLFYSWSAPRVADRLLGGWEIADLAEGGFPVFPRMLITNPRDELILRSYLDQPVILYGHQEDFAEGLDVLSDAAAHVGQAGPVKWISPERIARSSFLTRTDGTTLSVRPYARTVELELPVDVERVIVELPPSHGEPDTETVVCVMNADPSAVRSRFTRGRSDVFETLASRHLKIRLIRDDAVDLGGIPSPPRRLRPYIRRFATEGRDRLAPVVSRLRS